MILGLRCRRCRQELGATIRGSPPPTAAAAAAAAGRVAWLCEAVGEWLRQYDGRLVDDVAALAAALAHRCVCVCVCVCV